jgi:SAM-dependent methyltransferase
MVALHQHLGKVFRGSLDLNGPLMSPFLYMFECVRSYIEERREAFDARFGTDTASPTLNHGGDPTAYFYVPTTASLIYEILESIPLEQKSYAFVDMGSGKGRALLVASEFPFEKIVGVELSHELHEIAEENIKRYKPASQQCTAFDLKCMDVVDYKYGKEPLVLFLFDPFDRDTLKSVLANLEASLSASPRDVFVVYVYPQFEEVLQGSRILRMIKEGGPKWRPWSRYVIYAATAAAAASMGLEPPPLT